MVEGLAQSHTAAEVRAGSGVGFTLGVPKVNPNATLLLPKRPEGSGPIWQMCKLRLREGT